MFLPLFIHLFLKKFSLFISVCRIFLKSTNPALEKKNYFIVENLTVSHSKKPRAVDPLSSARPSAVIEKVKLRKKERSRRRERERKFLTRFLDLLRLKENRLPALVGNGMARVRNLL